LFKKLENNTVVELRTDAKQMFVAEMKSLKTTKKSSPRKMKLKFNLSVYLDRITHEIM